MKFVNMETDLPLNRLEFNLKKADFFHSDEKFSLWSLAEYNRQQKGIHLSYDEDTKKICAYYESGQEHNDFIAPINEIFTGKIKEKNGKIRIQGIICMSPLFNIIVLLIIIGTMSAYLAMRNPNLIILFAIFFIYFIYVKQHYKSNMQYIAAFLGDCTYKNKKKKKINPNKKKGKYARKGMS